MTYILPLLASLAFAQDQGLDDTRSVSTKTLDAYQFKIESCDTIRAIARVGDGADAVGSPKIVVSIENASSETCMYNGVAMTGWIKGSYVVSRRNAQDQGFFIPSGKTVSLRVSPADLKTPRGSLRLEIPPDQGLVVLVGMAPEEG